MTEYTAPVGAPVWIDLMTHDVDAAAAFYRAVFGWEAEPPNPEFGGYRNFRVNGNRVAGLMGARDGGDGPGDMWSTYLRTDDAAASLDAAVEAGASVIVPASDVGDLGRFGFVIDPVGAAIGVWEPGTHAGFVERGVPGTPYWFDCMSRSYDASLSFYRKVFGWTLEEIGSGGKEGSFGPDRYSQVLAGPAGAQEGVAGIMDAAPLFDSGVFGDGTPSFWQVYITVEDTDAAAKRIIDAGGQILRAAEVTPWGTMGSATDPGGAVFLFATPPAGR
ncbi:VOC family protein [Tsukamurella pseudospumae]|uniref:Glyoxalase n=1 Tax=Tsukamurella pseudospumae TaxID=239498 RepID=A0A138AWS5_9ACTN|nr:VOC family protein [Tsukamurella pseudospumae]KXP01453.1 glyoxalase [Tsukamurella pseudospumae]KXP14879.1 glyoxalase [Tsukamurella pseudospumae]